MGEEYYIMVGFPFALPDRGTLPMSLGFPVRGKEGCHIRNFMTIGDSLPCFYKDELVFYNYKGMLDELTECMIRLFSDLSEAEIVPVDDDLCGCPELEIREFARLYVQNPTNKPDEELTVCMRYRYNENGLSVSAARKETGEPLAVRIELL